MADMLGVLNGTLPKKKVVKISVLIDGKQIPVSNVFFCDIYECDNTFSIFKNGDTYFISQQNSDGAGGYDLVWVFTKEGLKQRLVGSVI